MQGRLDLDSDLGKRAARRLREEQVIWLVTVERDGIPQPSPVWFLWDETGAAGGGSLLIFSKPRTPKLRNIAANSGVALHFDSDGEGGDIIVLTGTAEVLVAGPPVNLLPPYADKYRAAMQGMGMTPQEMLREYSVALSVTPTRLRGF